MPLLDHFRPPLSEQRPWESFHTTWTTSLADVLNRDVLPRGYIALEQLHSGPAVEIDVGTFAQSAAGRPESAVGTATQTVWTPVISPVVLPAEFPPHATVQIVASEGGRSLVAAIELVSPGNKDRASKRRLFAAKCATYLSRGIGLIVIDVVSTRQGNLHNEMIDLVGWDADTKMTSAQNLYTVGYRPLRENDSDRIEAWPVPLVIGESLPTMPLSLSADLCLAVDLEAAYAEACQRRRLDEIVS
jgi:hypothetical protein